VMPYRAAAEERSLGLHRLPRGPEPPQ
jgi:hypothetical protein